MHLLKNKALWAGVAWLLSAGAAMAGPYTYSFDSSASVIHPGESVTVNVFVQQTGGSALQTEGLISAGVLLSGSSVPGLSVTAITPNPALSTANSMLSPPTLFVASPSNPIAELIEESINPVFAGADGKILLGSFTFTAAPGAVPGQILNFTASVPDASGGFSETVTGAFNFNVLDFGPDLGGTGPIDPANGTLAVVPEPSTLLLFAPRCSDVQLSAEHGDTGRSKDCPDHQFLGRRMRF